MSKPRVREVFATMAWFIWSHRNKSRLQEKSAPLSGIREAVCNFLQLFSSCREHSGSTKVVRRRTWQPLNPGEYKTNFDGAICLMNAMKLAWALWCEIQKVWWWLRWRKKKKPHSVECLELLAARRAMLFAKEIGLQQSHFEGDSETVINGLQGVGMHFSSLGHLARDTLFLVSSMWSFSFAHVVRQSNVVAHVLTQRARLSFPFSTWIEFVSSDIEVFVCADFKLLNNKIR